MIELSLSKRSCGAVAVATLSVLALIACQQVAMGATNGSRHRVNSAAFPLQAGKRERALHEKLEDLGTPTYMRQTLVATETEGEIIHAIGMGPGLDYDSDGVRDVIARDIALDINSSDAGDTKVLVFSGRNGRELWRLKQEGIAVPIPARVAGPGGNGMLIIRHDDSSIVTVTALSGKGRELWNQEFAGGVAPVSVLATNALEGIETDVFVAEREKLVPLLGPWTIRGSFIDGRDGSVHRPGSSQVSLGRPSAHSIADVSGDGLDDFVVIASDPVGYRLQAFRSVDAAPLWVTTDLAIDSYSEVTSETDVNGDGVRDVMVKHHKNGADVYDLDLSIVDGATGEKLWSKAASSMFAVGDTDGRPGDELLVYTLDREDPRDLSLTFGIYDFKDEPIFERKWTLPMEEQSGSGGEITNMGDLNSDGVHDLRVELLTPSRGGHRKRVAILSGLDGATLYGSRRLRAIGGSVDGRGDDLYRLPVGGPLIHRPLSIIDGKSGVLQWRTAMRQDQSWWLPAAAKLNGDRHADVLLFISELTRKKGKISGARILAGAIDGRSGRLRWTAKIAEGDQDLYMAPSPF